MKDLLLDTHIAIWMATNPDRISLSILEAIEEADHRFVSHISALEIQLKNLKNPTVFQFSIGHLEEVMKEFACTELPLTYQDIITLGSMEFLHADPFDRLLMAQAKQHKLRVVTFDRDILRTSSRYGAFEVFSEDRRNPAPAPS